MVSHFMNAASIPEINPKSDHGRGERNSEFGCNKTLQILSGMPSENLKVFMTDERMGSSFYTLMTC